MMITIFSLEFIFAHAVDELKAALDDLNVIHLKKQREEGLDNWTIAFFKPYGTIHQILQSSSECWAFDPR
jgi:hypothetical protein